MKQIADSEVLSISLRSDGFAPFSGSCAQRPGSISSEASLSPCIVLKLRNYKQQYTPLDRPILPSGAMPKEEPKTNTKTVKMIPVAM